MILFLKMKFKQPKIIRTAKQYSNTKI